ncbi:hypothetical protein IW262DRAFT_1281228 [Armillaria fumosa]|nr:hypothetical protein IW262DRAFT_1281228 [Armillaria fumosa]
MQQDRNAELITYLELSKIPERGESLIIDFAVSLFKTLGYVRRERVARTRVELPLLICGGNKHAKTDVCILDRTQNDILLVQAEDRLEHEERANARARLVAEAVAAFNENNAQREAIGLPPLAEKVSHARHCHGLHVACVLQNSRHPKFISPYSPWDVSSRGNPRDLLLPARSLPCPLAY